MDIAKEVHDCAMGIFFCEEQDGGREAWQPFEYWETEDIMTEVLNTEAWIMDTVNKILKEVVK